MAETTIEWCQYSFNPWWGCVEVSEGCTNCYARELSHRYKRASWGKAQSRVLAGQSTWNDPIKWNQRAMAKGVPARVFCASMADVFEDQPGVQMVNSGGQPAIHPHLGDPLFLDDARQRMWGLIEHTRWLRWLLLTKRPENILRMLPFDWPKYGGGFVMPKSGSQYCNVWLGTTVENQRRADERIPILADVPCRLRFLSCEPLLGRVDLDKHLRGGSIGWVIVGGESGGREKVRPVHLEWIEEIVACCKNYNVPVFVKQFGRRPQVEGPSGELLDLKLKDDKGGDVEEWDEHLRVREFPDA